MQKNTPPQKELLDIDTFLDIYSISRSRFYAQVKKKALIITKLENRTYITRKNAEAWLDKITQDSTPN